MRECYCDVGETPEFFVQSRPMARSEHTCCECGGTIQKGERYGRYSGKWDGQIATFCRCYLCLFAADTIRLRLKCFCDIFGELWEEVYQSVEYMRESVPGLAFQLARVRWATEHRDDPRTTFLN